MREERTRERVKKNNCDREEVAGEARELMRDRYFIRFVIYIYIYITPINYRCILFDSLTIRSLTFVRVLEFILLLILVFSFMQNRF